MPPLALLCSNNRLQLPCISQGIFNDLVTRHGNILARELAIILREVYPTVLDNPSRLLCEVNDGTFRVKKEEGFGVGNRDRGVCFLAARGDLFADGADEDLLYPLA